ncbi:hypothetical protein JCM33374_g5093 [Metschnikowia sp. JCM 33374]|nr:hypothetical protein JCM33374_g5093 [Metschnikowia sp. JCM 33374]
MNYDPIHDTYTPSAESKPAISGNQTSVDSLSSEHPQASCNQSPDMVPYGDSLTSPYHLNKSATVSSPAVSSGRPHSNVHSLLDNSPSDAESEPQNNISDINRENRNCTKPNSGIEVSALISETNKVTGGPQHFIEPKTAKYSSGIEASRATKTWSPRNEVGNFIHPASRDATSNSVNHFNPNNTPRAISGAPFKDVKLSINNLVASESNNGDYQNSPSTFTKIYDTNTPSVTSDADNQRILDNMGQNGQFEDSDTPPSEHDVPIGTLPPDFRSVSNGFKHLKKADGEPFWRRDIQYDFLEELFNDKQKVFTNTFSHCEVPNAANGDKLTFAELYVRTLAESSKSSRVLRERLIKDWEMGISVSKVCLLVNAGRMNTTINFVPDMRSALRTYHSIPSLQVDPDGVSKPLQDTPRLKTILKAVCEGQDHFITLLELLKAPAKEKPNTNVIKLIFLMSAYFQNIPYHSDDSVDGTVSSDKFKNLKTSSGPQNRFMEFFLNDEIHPRNRAKRFLWLMYTYMETSFTEAELEQNPFNPKRIPPIEYISPEDMGLFDKDTDYEIEYAAKMYHTRLMHLMEDTNNSNNHKRGNRMKRERQVLKRIHTEQSHRSGLDATENDSADDSIVGDESVLVDDIDGRDEMESLEDSTKSITNSDRSKRKKPTPSVGSLVDDNKRLGDSQPKWENPQFPLVNLKAIRSKFSACADHLPIKRLEKGCSLSIHQKKAVAQRSKSIIAHMIKTDPNYESKRKEVTQWMYRYFQYKKSTGNGLLAMEWEDVRQDLLYGIETYLYQQLGKVLIMHNHDEQLDEERHENGDPELLKRENFVTSSDHLPGDSAPIDIGDIDVLGSGFSPSHDFDKANERSTYEYSLLQIAEDILSQNFQRKTSNFETVHFNFESESLSFTKEG